MGLLVSLGKRRDKMFDFIMTEEMFWRSICVMCGFIAGMLFIMITDWEWNQQEKRRKKGEIKCQEAQ